MNEKVVEILKKTDKALDIYELQDILGLKTVEEIQDLQKALEEMVNEAILYHSNKDRYMLLKDSNLHRGVVRANKKGFGFVDIDDSETDVYVAESNLNGALHDDIVLVEITSKKGISSNCI